MFFLTTPVHQVLHLADWQIDNTLDRHACVKYMTYFRISTKRKMRRFGTFFEIAERRQSCYHGTRMVIICSGLNFMSGRSLADWFRENRTDISIDTFLIVIAIYFAASPARSTFAILLQAGVVTGILTRAYLAWRDWHFVPKKLNKVWHKLGRDGGARFIGKVARIYDLGKREDVALFVGELGPLTAHPSGFSGPLRIFRTADGD